MSAPRILVIGPRWVGDMVMAQCLFTALKARWPEAVIDVIAPDWASPLLARMPEVRARLDANFPRGALQLGPRWRAGRALRGRYDQAYVLQGSWKSALLPMAAGIPLRVGYLREQRWGLLNHIVPLPEDLKRQTAQAFFRLAGGGSFRRPQLDVDADNLGRLLEQHDLDPGTYVALMPGAEFGPAKRWPSASYAKLARVLMRQGFQVMLLGSANDQPVGAEIAGLAPGVRDLCGQTRLEDAIDLLAGAALAVSNDSGLMHVAAAVETPVVAIFGSTSYQNTPPLAERRALVSLNLPCSPCHQRTCPLGHLNCLNQLAPEQVLRAAEPFLGSPDATLA